MAVASLVLGIISLFFGLFGIGFRFLGIILAIIGIILSSKKKNTEYVHLAKAGKICSIIGLILCLIIFLAGFIFAGWISAYISSGMLSEISEFLHELRSVLFS